MTQDLKREEVLPLFRMEFPNFDTIADASEGPYTALGDFAVYLGEGIVDKSLPEEELQRAFKVMNLMGRSSDLEVQNLLCVGMLEILTDTDEAIKVCRQRLISPAAELFERVKREL